MLRKPRSYNIDVPKSRKQPVVVILLVIILFAVAGTLAYTKYYRKPKQVDVNNQNEINVHAEEVVIGKYLFSGTVVLDRAVQRDAKGDYNQPFSGLESFTPEQYDGWLVDLECPVTANKVIMEQQTISTVFNCDTEWLEPMSKYFNFVNLANNHTNDMGKQGFLETQTNLDKTEYQIVGNYDPAVSQDACEVMSLPVHIASTNGKEPKRGNLPVAFCAFHYFSRQPKVGEMDIVKSYSELMPVFGFMHVGQEYLPTAGIDQQNVAHSLIDLGSEFVIGNSPHWVQNSEVYKNRPIFYSTGNFIFDQLTEETNRGLNLDIEMSVQNDQNISRWLELGEECLKRGDDCLRQAKFRGLTKPKLKLNYEPIASVGGARTVTTKASYDVQKSVEERLNWLQTKALLGQ